MNYLDYCGDKAARAGYSWPFVFLYLGNTASRPLTIALAFLRELEEIFERNLEPEISHLRLLWWKNELERHAHDPSMHPVLRAIQEYNVGNIVTLERLQQLLSAAEDRHDQFQAVDEAVLLAMAEKSYGVLHEILANTCTADSSFLPIARNLGVAEFLLRLEKSALTQINTRLSKAECIDLAATYLQPFLRAEPGDFRFSNPGSWIAGRFIARSLQHPDFDPRRSPVRANWIAWRAARAVGVAR